MLISFFAFLLCGIELKSGDALWDPFLQFCRTEDWISPVINHHFGRWACASGLGYLWIEHPLGRFGWRSPYHILSTIPSSYTARDGIAEASQCYPDVRNQKLGFSFSERIRFLSFWKTEDFFFFLLINDTSVHWWDDVQVVVPGAELCKSASSLITICNFVCLHIGFCRNESPPWWIFTGDDYVGGLRFFPRPAGKVAATLRDPLSLSQWHPLSAWPLSLTWGLTRWARTDWFLQGSREAKPSRSVSSIINFFSWRFNLTVLVRACFKLEGQRKTSCFRLLSRLPPHTGKDKVQAAVGCQILQTHQPQHPGFESMETLQRDWLRDPRHRTCLAKFCPFTAFIRKEKMIRTPGGFRNAHGHKNPSGGRSVLRSFL